MALHPVDVALERIDLTIVREHAERLRQPPLREGVRRITLVIDRKGTLEPLVHQIWVKYCNLLCEHHAFVDHRTTRQRRKIELADACRCCCLFDAATDHVELTLERIFIHAFGIGDENLLYLWACRVGLFTETSDVHRHMAPAIDVVAHAQNFGLDDRAAGFLSAEICTRQEDLTNRHQLIFARGVTCAFNLIIKERDGDLHMDTRAIAGLAIRIHSATVPDRFQCINARFYDFARRRPVHRDNKTDAARAVLFALIIQTVFGHISALGFFVLHPVCVIYSH